MPKLKFAKILAIWVMPAIILALLLVLALVKPKPVIPGVLMGQVAVGPICPVEQEGVPCPVPPEAYTSREIIVYRTNHETIVATTHPDATGAYRFELRPGTYIVDLSSAGIGSFSKDLPREVRIESGKTITLDIAIDTGIR